MSTGGDPTRPITISSELSAAGTQAVIVTTQGERPRVTVHNTQHVSVPPSTSRSASISPSITSLLQPANRPLSSLTIASALQALTANAQLQMASGSTQAPSTGRPILRPAPLAQQQSSKVNLNVRVINPHRKSDCETCVLHNIGSHNISTPDCLRREIWKQFGSDVVSSKLDFPIGYMKGGSKISIKSVSDIQDVWGYVRSGTNITLWCNGLLSSEKHQSSSGSDDEDISVGRKPKRKKKLSALEEKNERVEGFMSELREKHGIRFTSIQYRIWAEMLDVKSHK